MTTARKLNQRENAIIECLLKEPFKGRDELRAQIAGARVRPGGPGQDNYGSLTFEVKDGPKAPVILRVPVDAVAEDSDGVPIEFLLHVVDGIVDELEIYKADGTPILKHPEANELTVRTYSSA